VKRLALLVPLVVVLVGCGGGGDSSGESGDSGGKKGAMDCEITGDESKAELADLDADKTHRLVVSTNKGDFTIELATDVSPCTTASFAGLVQTGFFDGLIFHRIAPGFVIQGGDPAGDGTGGPGYQTVDTPPSDTTYEKGIVAMAKTAADPPGTSGSQFFVVTSDSVNLPPEYAVLGRVVEGLDTIDKIGALGDSQEQPTERVEIDNIKLVTG
jgi:cyclophilin family peptidyl-prolyl cis-trans isomerase